MRYVIFLLLTGCTYTPTLELEDQLFACFNAHAQGCELIEAELSRREEIKKHRAERQGCPHNAKCFYPDGWRWQK